MAFLSHGLDRSVQNGAMSAKHDVMFAFITSTIMHNQAKPYFVMMNSSLQVNIEILMIMICILNWRLTALQLQVSQARSVKRRKRKKSGSVTQKWVNQIMMNSCNETLCMMCIFWSTRTPASCQRTYKSLF